MEQSETSFAITPANAAPAPVPSLSLEDLVRRAASYARQTSADSTRTAYAKDWRDFVDWCQAIRLEALPAEPATVGTYLTALASRGLAVATLVRRLAAISTTHRLSGYRLDTGHLAIRDLMRGIRRELGVRQRQVRPACTNLVQAMARSCDGTLSGLRDRSLLLLCFASALRRGECVALELKDIEIGPEGLRITVARSKTDQEQAGVVVGVLRTGSDTCPVLALQAWLDASDIKEGRVFRSVNRHGGVGQALSAQSVALIVKRRTRLIGLDNKEYSAHSLRAGLATSAARQGLEERDIQRQTRHRTLNALRVYIREGETLGSRNVSGLVGL